MHRGTVAEIDLAAIEKNLNVIMKRALTNGVMAVVKADAYGHGAAEVAKRLALCGVSGFVVSYTEEARHLRDAGISDTILVLFNQDSPDDYFRYNLVPVIGDMASAERFAEAAVKNNSKLTIHMKIDTGMGRLGFLPDEAVWAASNIAEMKGLRLSGLMSHFSDADCIDRSHAEYQLQTFNRIRSEIMSSTGLQLFCHMSNSAAALSMPEASFDAVRPGIALYGCSPFQDSFGLTPVMSVKSRIVAVRNISAGSSVGYGRAFVAGKNVRIGVVSAGYADGYSRHFSNNAEMLVRGHRVPVVGRICMDLTMIDVTGLPDVSERDEVVMVGRQGDEQITASELALRINTIPYEILTSLGPAAGKVYIN